MLYFNYRGGAGYSPYKERTRSDRGNEISFGNLRYQIHIWEDFARILVAYNC